MSRAARSIYPTFSSRTTITRQNTGTRRSNAWRSPLQAYNGKISAAANKAVRAKAERLWTANIKLQRLINTVERSGRALLVAVVEDTCPPPLKEESTFYNKVPLCNFFARIKGGSGGLEATGIVFLLSAKLGWWADNRLKDTQKKSVRAKLPIDDKWLTAIATGSLLAAGSFPKQRPDWDSPPCANKTWNAWKRTFRTHQLTLESEQHAAGERGDVFGSAASTITIHGITAATATPGALLTPDTLAFHAASATATTPAGDFGLQALDSHLDRMADAATNSGLTLFQLTDANVRLTATTLKQYEAIKKLLTKIKLSSSSSNTRSPSTGAGATTPDQKTLKLLQTAIRNCCSIGGFCSSHGWGFGNLHTSSSCNNKAPGHVDTAT